MNDRHPDEPDSLDDDSFEAGSTEDRQDHLLRSLEDLEREHAAGDMSDEDFESLRADYTARAAAALRGEDEAVPVAVPAPRRSAGRTAAVVGGVLALALVAGIALARGSGQRGGGGLTGDAGGIREQLAACQPLAFQQPKKGIACYQKILDTAPEDLDALTYQGWAMVRAGRPEDGAKRFATVVKLDPKYPDVRVFRAVLASRAEAWDSAAAEVDGFFKNDPPPVAIQVLKEQGLEFKVFIGLQPAATQACWVAAAQGLDPKAGFDQAFIDRLGTCLDKVLNLEPKDPQARFSRALAAIGPDRQDVATAERLVGELLAEDPANANALLLKARIDLAANRVDAAELQAERLAQLPRPTAAFLIGEPTDLLAAVRQTRAAATSTTTTMKSASVSTVPGAPTIPNASGG